jgi:hypothetical protein
MFLRQPSSLAERFARCQRSTERGSAERSPSKPHAEVPRMNDVGFHHRFSVRLMCI